MVHLLLTVCAAVCLQDDVEAIRVLGRTAADEAAKELGSHREAIDAPLRAAPYPSSAYDGRGTAMVRAGDGQAAKYCFGMAVAADPANASALANLGFTLLKLGEIPGAEMLLQLASRSFPACAEVRNNYAFALLESGRREEALGELQVAAKLIPRHPQIGYSLAWLLDQMGRPREALAVADPLVPLYPCHDSLRELRDRLQKAAEEDEPEVEPRDYPGEREPDPAEVAAFVAGVLRRCDELEREHSLCVEELRGLWTSAERKRIEREEAEKDETLSELMERAATDPKAEAELREATELLPVTVVRGLPAACAMGGNEPMPGEEVIETLALDFRGEESGLAEQRQALREKRTYSRDDAFEACSLLGLALGRRTSALQAKLWFEQHKRYCRPAMDAVRGKLGETRKALAELKAFYEAELEKLRADHAGGLIKDDEYEKKRKRLETRYRQDCQRLIFGFRYFVASKGNVWKGRVDAHREELVKLAGAQLDEYEEAVRRLYSICGRLTPVPGLERMIEENAKRHKAATMVSAKRIAYAAPPRASTASGLGLMNPDSYGYLPEAIWPILRAELAEWPEPVHFNSLGVNWDPPFAPLDHAPCATAFDVRGYDFEIEKLKEVRLGWIETLESLGLDASVFDADLWGYNFSISPDGTVSIEVGKILRGGVSVNPFRGRVGVRFGAGIDAGGVGAHAFVTLDNDHGLGWMAEVAAGKSTLKLKEETWVALAPQK